MKKFLLAILSLTCFSTSFGMGGAGSFSFYHLENEPEDFESREFWARSFMFTRPIFLNNAMQQAIWHNEIYNKEGKQRASFQVTAAYQHSRDDAAAARYFLLPCKNSLIVAGDEVVTNGEDEITPQSNCRDIRAEWLNLPSNFNGSFSLCPEQAQWGVITEFNQDLCKFFDWKLLENWWVSVQLPIVKVTNDLNLKQHIINPGTPSDNPLFPRDIIQAFNQPLWNYGKIGGKRSRVELATIWLRLGSAYMANEHQIAYYSGILFPTGSKQHPEFLFDPVTGLNGHIGINAGVNFNILLNRDNTKYGWYFFVNLDDIFLVRNDQCRTLSVYGQRLVPKLLSRFLSFNQENCPAEQNVPGVNILTSLVRVKPFNLVDFSTGFRFLIKNNVEIELGFNIWGHGQEKLEIRHPFEFKINPLIPPFGECDTGLPLFGIAGTDGNSASTSNIKFQGPNDPVFVPLTFADFDVYSASAGGALNYRAHGSIGGTYHGAIDIFYGAGWYLEFPQKNGALKTWGSWGKVGASF